MMSIIYMLAGIGSLVCLIMVLVKAFQNKNMAVGIIGIFCGIVAFVWGWMNTPKIVPKNVMLAWTICIILMIISGAMGGLPQYGT
mgnify:CR=1 FL=1